MIDFGQYDNDGLDGIPNSGDDDGYVDFVSIVHAERGEECSGETGNIWSHRSSTYHGRDDAGNTVSSGVYFYRLVAGDFSDVRKMTLVK